MGTSLSEVEKAKNRCISLRDQTLEPLPPSKISNSSKLTLHRLLSSELRFLSHLSSSQSPSFHPIHSLNLGYLESILRAVRHPSVCHVSRICKPVHGVHVDVVCTFARSPAWLFVSDRNPNYIFWSQSQPQSKSRSLKSRIHNILAAARSAIALKPALIFLVFSKGVADDVARKLADEFGAVEVDFLGVGRAFEIKIGEIGPGLDSGGGKVGILRGLEDGKGFGRDVFGSLVSSMRPDGDETVELVNFDTTALVALVSGISNGGCERLLQAPEVEMRTRFKSNYDFVIAQVMSELQLPILSELRDVIAGKKGIICASVCSEFNELVLMCGGPNEKLRADLLIKHLLVVPDSPSERVAALPTTRKIAPKNKIVFGTGDYWQAPTLTANMGFVRAISQTGMSLFTIEHRPRALTGD